MTTLQIHSTEVNDVEASCDEQGNSRLTLDTTAALGQEEVTGILRTQLGVPMTEARRAVRTGGVLARLAGER